MKTARLVTCIRGIDSVNADKNDCTVRAWANHFDVSYQEAYEFLKYNGRKDGKGMSSDDLERLYKSNGVPLYAVGTTQQANRIHYILRCPRMKGCTLENLLKRKEFQTGVHSVLVKNHIIAIKDGKCVDKVKYLRAGTRVTGIFTNAQIQEVLTPYHGKV